MTTPFETYISKVETDLRGGKATEHTYRGTLETFMEALERGIEASNDPKHIECGAPDFIVEKRKVPLGYVETKDVGIGLDKIEKTDQLKRYLKALNNLILTDYLEFRWYVNGEKKRTIRLAEIGKNNHLTIDSNAEANLTQLFKDFYATETPTVDSPKELAKRLAGVTHFIRDIIIDVLTSGEPSIQKAFAQRFSAFKDLLLPALKEEEFADLYAQTMTYGLFAAKLSAPEKADFTLTSAYQFLFGNKFLRRLFSDVSEELDEIEIIRPYLLDIVSLLNRADFHSILAEFGKRTRTEDPVVHFYETFLATYDPKLRNSRGVFYTPEPAVQFIVNAIHYLLKTRFNLAWGLADSSVKVLDPAAGTGTFLFYIILKIYEETVTTRKQAGQWKQKSKDLLERVFGFELLIAPYVVSHLKLGLLLKELGAPLEGKEERLHVYLTNTLEEGVTRAEQLAGLGHYIAEEASDAAFVKKNQQIVVVAGNPPYSGNSANASVDKDGKPNFIGKLLREYYFVDGAPLGERNPKWLQDDYVKFIRFGEWRINQTGHGILAFITNHGYLDNPTFRGMRQHLMTTFDEIYVLDLHGNSKKKEKTPDGGKDENVFDIQQGVAIMLAVKHANKTSEAPKSGETSEVYHASLWGKREDKYAALRDNSLDDIEWKELQPDKPFYLFAPQDIELRSEYEQGWKVTDLFPVNVLGFQTHRDNVAIDFDIDVLRRRIQDIRDTVFSDEQLRSKYDISDSGSWKLANARSRLKAKKAWEKRIINCLYRPFDERPTFLDDTIVDRPRPELLSHVAFQENLCLLSSRQQATLGYYHCWVSDTPANDCAISTTSREANQVFPLYLYTTPEETAGTLFAQSEVTRKPNLAPEFIKAVEEKLGIKFNPTPPALSGTLPKSANKTAGNTKISVADLERAGEGLITPEDIFHYAYAVFHSPTYRTRYAEFLKIDFPRLPITSDKKLFRKLAEKGKELVELHLLKSSQVDDFVTTYPEAGDNKVEFVRPDMSHQKSDKQNAGVDKGLGKQKSRGDMSGLVWINDKQYFGNVPEEVYEFKVGGYQVCEKWLKDRKGRVLSGEDITHYQRVVVSLKETIRLMKEIDKAIVKWPME